MFSCSLLNDASHSIDLYVLLFDILHRKLLEELPLGKINVEHFHITLHSLSYYFHHYTPRNNKRTRFSSFRLELYTGTFMPGQETNTRIYARNILFLNRLIATLTIYR
jgi:hypothetical protein